MSRRRVVDKRVTRRRRGVNPALWRNKRDAVMDRYDGFDPQIPAWKLLPIFDWCGYVLDLEALDRSSEVLPPELLPEVKEVEACDPDLLVALKANLRNALTEQERLVLEMRYQQKNIGGARVLRAFTHKGYIMRPGQYLAPDEIENMSRQLRRTLQKHKYLKIYGPDGDSTFEAIAQALGLRDRAHAFAVHQSAIKKLRKHLQKLRRKKPNI